MILPPQAHFTPLHRPINQGDSETQQKPGFLYAYTDISGVMSFEIPTFDFQHRSTRGPHPLLGRGLRDPGHTKLTSMVRLMKFK